MLTSKKIPRALSVLTWTVLDDTSLEEDSAGGSRRSMRKKSMKRSKCVDVPEEGDPGLTRTSSSTKRKDTPGNNDIKENNENKQLSVDRKKSIANGLKLATQAMALTGPWRVCESCLTHRASFHGRGDGITSGYRYDFTTGSNTRWDINFF